MDTSKYTPYHTYLDILKSSPIDLIELLSRLSHLKFYLPRHLEASLSFSPGLHRL